MVRRPPVCKDHFSTWSNGSQGPLTEEVLALRRSGFWPSRIGFYVCFLAAVHSGRSGAIVQETVCGHHFGVTPLTPTHSALRWEEEWDRQNMSAELIPVFPLNSAEETSLVRWNLFTATALSCQHCSICWPCSSGWMGRGRFPANAANNRTWHQN